MVEISLVMCSYWLLLFWDCKKKKKTEAHMFWWYYRSPYRVEDPNKPWPIILWLQGGPVSIGSLNLINVVMISMILCKSDKSVIK